MRKRILIVSGISLALGGFVRVGNAAVLPTGTVYASVAPNQTSGSTGWPGYDANAMASLQSGASSAGDATQPSYYSQLADGADLPEGAFIVTGFSSWMGNADPATTYGANYANEYGNRIQYGAVINGNGAKISISQLSFNLDYNDATTTNYSLVSYGEGSYDYDADHEGVIFGPGGPTYVTSGSSDQLVDEIITRGSGVGYAVYSSDDGATNQDKIDNYLATNFGTDPYSFTGEYFIDTTPVGTATENFNVPEPASVGILALSGLAMLRRRRV